MTTTLDKIKKKYYERFGGSLEWKVFGINGVTDDVVWEFIQEVYLRAQQDKVEEIEGWATQNIKSGKDYDKLYEFLHQPKENKK